MDWAAHGRRKDPSALGRRVGSGRVGEGPRHGARGGRQDGPAVKAAILRLIPCASRGSPAGTLHDHVKSRLRPDVPLRAGNGAGRRVELAQGTRASSTRASAGASIA